MRAFFLTAPLLALLPTNLNAADPPLAESGQKVVRTACHGTSVEFVDTPVEAAKLAAQQRKLVLVLHVSGHFEDPGLT